MKRYVCPICGYPNLDESPRNEKGMPSFDICDCCGIEFGYEDCTEESAIEYRKRWIDSGGEWFSKELKPSNWDIENQLKNIE
ncbi:MAG: hypothetical protein ACRC30_07010 [Clostridium sp.]